MVELFAVGAFVADRRFDVPAPACYQAGDSPREQRLSGPDHPAPDPRWWICTTSSNTAFSEEMVCSRRPDSLASGQSNL